MARRRYSLRLFAGLRRSAACRASALAGLDSLALSDDGAGPRRRDLASPCRWIAGRGSRDGLGKTARVIACLAGLIVPATASRQPSSNWRARPRATGRARSARSHRRCCVSLESRISNDSVAVAIILSSPLTYRANCPASRIALQSGNRTALAQRIRRRPEARREGGSATFLVVVLGDRG